MNRVHHRQAEAVSAAFQYIPSRLHDALGCDLFCGDPIFAGIFTPQYDNETTTDGRSYRRIAHVGFPFHTRDKRTTLVWPAMREEGFQALYVAVHELGHVLHQCLTERAGWKALPWLHNVTEYAQRDYWECFAEAFAAWVLYRPATMDGDPYFLGYSRENAEWFDRLMLA